MRIHRPISAGNIRPFLLFLVITVVLSLLPMLSHAAVFWDDEMEQGNTNFSAAYMLSTLIPNGNMAYDTSVKFSGNGSIRLNYPANCLQGPTTGSQCGGGITRQFPPSLSVYKRVYFRMSGAGPNTTADGKFKTSTGAFTKLMKGQSDIVDGLTARHWWTMGCCGSKNFMITMEYVPNNTSATNAYSNITFQDNRWYCIETHEAMNTPGVANGVAEAWVDGVKVLTQTAVMWQRVGTNHKWKDFSIIRQEGMGNLWFDRFAAGDTRIGCSGSIPQGDTAPPTIPSGVSAR